MSTKLTALALLAPLAGVIIAGSAQAQTVTVTTTDNAIDISSFTGTIADLPGPDGLVSLYEAMVATNNTPGHQTIAFAIPPAELGWIGPTYDGVAVFHALTGFEWISNDLVTIDATTQTAFAGDTNPNGGEVLLYSKTMNVNASGSIVRGFHSTSIGCSGGVTVEGCTGTTNITVFGGSGAVIQGNVGGTLKLDRTNDAVVLGNTFQRIRVQGFGAGNEVTGTVIGGPNPGDRNFLTGYGSYNSEGLPSGHAIQLFYTRDTVIENNSIGTTVDGLAQGNLACTIGISLESHNADLVIRDNRIAGILGHGMGPHYAGTLWGWAIYFWGTASNVEIASNTIGLDANGDPTLGSVWGVNVDNFSGYSYDGIRLVGNEIAGHIFNGVRVGPVADMLLSQNSIHDNGWLGIDLIPSDFKSGVSLNDPLDADDGGNGVQNFPVLTFAANEGGLLHVAGTLDSTPNDVFTVELFASPACHPDGFGEGETFLGSTPIQTDASGHASFDLTFPVALSAGDVVTATATLDALGQTSEFSMCEPVVDQTCQTDLGFGGPGTALLTLCGGDLSTGTTATLALTGAPAGAPGVLGVGTVFAPTPVLGGTLVPFPPNSITAFVTDGSGAFTVPGVPGGGGPASLFAQCAILDAAQPFGWAISNALQIDVLP